MKYKHKNFIISFLGYLAKLLQLQVLYENDGEMVMKKIGKYLEESHCLFQDIISAFAWAD
jgi:hypothetical protein